MAESNAFPDFESRENVPLDSKLNVLDHQLAHLPIGCQRITRKTIEDLAIEKYRSGGKGITFNDVQRRFSLRKAKVQRSLKHFHRNKTLFTARDLDCRGISLQNTNPQHYFPSSIKADIIEDLKRRSANVPVQPTGSNLIGSDLTVSNLSNHDNALSNAIGYQKAKSFLDVLIHLPFPHKHIHKLQLILSIDREYYQKLSNKAAPINRAKRHEEIIGRRHVTYTFSPNGRVEIAVRSSDTPFKLEDDDDLVILFSFFGQVRDRLIYLVSDIREREVPQITEWILKECDLNKDVEIDEKCQMYLPDIQLKYANQVFRMYIKSLHDRSVYRVEKSLTLSVPLVNALDGLVLPMRAINELTEEVRQIRQIIDSKLTN
jgi:hypothetical protein